MQRIIEVIPYHSSWPARYQHEAALIKAALGPDLCAIHHIGSTAIPNMSAKPVIDIMLECCNLNDIERIKAELAPLGYTELRRSVVPHWSFFSRKVGVPVSFHLHLREVGDPQIKRHVRFRDYLIHHPQEAAAYEALKIQLAQQYHHDITRYVMGKDKFVQAIDIKAKLWKGSCKDFAAPNTGAVAKTWTREKILKAMDANLNVHMTHFAQYINEIELIRIPGYTIVNSGLMDDTFNYVLETDCNEENVTQNINAITTYFQKTNTPFSWWIGPYDKPADLAARLEQQGYVNTENNLAMYFDLDAWDANIMMPGELEIIRALDKQTLRDFALVLANNTAAFEQYYAWIADIVTAEDPVEFYVGYVNGKPVVRGLSCYFAGVAGLHALSTVAGARHKGYGSAMQGFRLKRAKELGYHIAVLQASQQGFPLYQRLGYKECGVYHEYKRGQS